MITIMYKKTAAYGFVPVSGGFSMELQQIVGHLLADLYLVGGLQV